MRSKRAKTGNSTSSLTSLIKSMTTAVSTVYNDCNTTPFLTQLGRKVKYTRSNVSGLCDKTINPLSKQQQVIIDLFKWTLLIVFLLVFIYSFLKILQPSNSSLYRFIEFFVLFVCGFLIFSWFQKFWYGVNLF